MSSQRGESNNLNCSKRMSVETNSRLGVENEPKAWITRDRPASEQTVPSALSPSALPPAVSLLETLQTKSKRKTVDELEAWITRNPRRHSESNQKALNLLKSMRKESRRDTVNELKAWITRDPEGEQTATRRKSLSLLESLESEVGAGERPTSPCSSTVCSSSERDADPQSGREGGGSICGVSGRSINTAMLSLNSKRSSFRVPEELAPAVENSMFCEDQSPRKNIVHKSKDHHSLPDAESLKLDAECVPTKSKARQTCHLILRFLVSNIQLFVILGLSIALFFVLLLDSSSNVTGTRNIESSLRRYVEREHHLHPEFLGDALLRDPLSSQGKALQKTVLAGSSGDISTIGTYAMWMISYQLSGDEVNSDGATAGVWSDYSEVWDVCLWRGVQCDGRGNVAVLNLEDRNVKGDLPPEVYLLKESLKGLNLKNNTEMGRNGGSVPAFLEHMTKLKYINVCGTAYSRFNDASSYCASGTDKLVYADFHCKCCVQCDDRWNKLSGDVEK